MTADRNFKDLQIDCEIFQRSERFLIYGGSFSGKSHMVQGLVLRHHEKFRKIIICGTRNDLLTYPQTRDKTVLYENDDNPIYDPFTVVDTDIEDKRQTLLILDDLMSESYNSQLVNRMFSKGRHLNLSIILILQSYYPQGASKSLIPQIKNNASIQIFFKLRNKSEMKSVARKLEYGKKGQDFFDELVEREIYGKKYGYITIFMDEHCQAAKYRNNLVFEDGTPFETIFTK